MTDDDAQGPQTSPATPPEREGRRRRRRMDALTPAEIVVELDRFIVGQTAAKRALAIALRNRFRRRQLPYERRRDITPKNILMIGPTGVGKTEMVRRMAHMLEAPFIKVEATKYTEVGYVGRDVESIIHDLVEETVARLHDRRLADVQAKAEQRATERLVDYVVAQAKAGSLKSSTSPSPVRLPLSIRSVAATATVGEDAKPELDGASRRRIGRLLRTEKLDDAMIEIEVTPEIEPYDGYWEYGPAEGPEPYHEGPPPIMARARPRSRVVCIRDAKRILTREEANKLIDFDAVVDEALERVEEGGVVFIDELDKLGGRGQDTGADVSGEGVQRDLLPIVEGSVVMTRYGPVSTHHLLFVAAGSFTRIKPSDLIPELQGRFPLRVELAALSKEDLEAILIRPENSLCSQYQALLSTEGVTLEFTADGIEEMAEVAATCNRRIEDIGARRLATVLEQVLEEISFTAPDLAGSTITIDRAFVRSRTAGIVANDDLNRFIL